MRLILEQPVRARLVTPGSPELPIRPTLRYRAAEPFAVHIDFPAHVSADEGGVTWTFARSLLEEGLDGAAGIGDVRIRRYGRSRTVVEFHAPHGMAAIRLGTASLRRFLQRSYAVVEPGREDLGPELDNVLMSLLDGV
ncbi:SsgD protein [Streptomyces viridochromogenes]|uniref:SsgD protein n=1 Tax=Streptomyces viridochromogenes TaxID=1938 RepID=A0A0J7ZB69_STRVR|nr:SsgA family sporulation/cell division regulator [Streptomyces viridochromogenes]KMS72423.1 SsgD protein [Streptomyces viridochromogenes]KOG17525.1 SsgD protein [Streptomyces viridochromogenes]KOG25723.1 SsgD protein [Streptomyces viridochromogenes]